MTQNGDASLQSPSDAPPPSTIHQLHEKQLPVRREEFETLLENVKVLLNDVKELKSSFNNMTSIDGWLAQKLEDTKTTSNNNSTEIISAKSWVHGLSAGAAIGTVVILGLIGVVWNNLNKSLSEIEVVNEKLEKKMDDVKDSVSDAQVNIAVLKERSNQQMLINKNNKDQ